MVPVTSAGGTAQVAIAHQLGLPTVAEQVNRQYIEVNGHRFLRWTQRTRPEGRQSHHLPDDGIMNALLKRYHEGNAGVRRNLNSAILERLQQLRDRAGSPGASYSQFDGDRKISDIGTNRHGELLLWWYDEEVNNAH